MAGPTFWERLVDFQQFLATLRKVTDSHAAGSALVEADLKKLQDAVRTLPGVEGLADQIDALADVPGTEVIGGVGGVRGFARLSRAVARQRLGGMVVEGPELNKSAAALVKELLADPGKQWAVRQELLQDLNARVVEATRVRWWQDAGIQAGLKATTVSAVLGSVVAAAQGVVVPPTTEPGARGPWEGGIPGFSEWFAGLREAAGRSAEAVDRFMSEHQMGVGAARIPQQPQLGPSLGPQPLSPGEQISNLAGEILRIWWADHPGEFWDAELVYQVDKDGKVVKDAKGQFVVDMTKGVPTWKATKGAKSTAADQMNLLASLVTAANKGEAALVQKVLVEAQKTPQVASQLRRVLPLFYDTPYAPSTTTKETIDNWVHDYDKAEYAKTRSQAVVAEALDKKIATAQAILGRTSLSSDEQIALGTVEYGKDGWAYSTGATVPETLRGPSRFMGIAMPDDDPREVLVGNTLTRPEIVAQFRDAWDKSKNLEFKDYLTNELGAFDEALAAKLAYTMMSENATTYRRTEKTQAGWRPYDPDSPEPLPHTEPMSPAAWLDLNSKKMLNRADEQRMAEKARATARVQRAEADVLKFAQDITDPVKRDFVLANPKLVAATWLDAGGELTTQVDHLYSLDKAKLEAAKRDVERREHEEVGKKEAARDKLNSYAVGLPAGSAKRDFIYRNIPYLTNLLIVKGGDIEVLVDKEFSIDKQIKDEKKAAERVTWADLGRLSEDQRVLAVYGFYKRDAEGNISRDDIALEQLQQRPGERTGDWVERAKVELRTKLTGLPLPIGATVGGMAQAGFAKGNIQVESNALDQMFESGVFGTKPLSPQDKSLWGDYQTMVEFQAQQVAPNQQEAYRLAAAQRWPDILAAIEARLGPPKKKGDAAEMLAEETSRKQAAAEMIRQTDVPAMVGVRKIPEFDTARQMSEAFFAQRGQIPRAQLPTQEIQKRETVLTESFQRAAETPAVQRQVAVEKSMREGADPGALAGAVAWEAAQAAERQAFQLEQELRPQREAAARRAAEEFERTRLKPQPFRPTFWRFGPSFGRR